MTTPELLDYLLTTDRADALAVLDRAIKAAKRAGIERAAEVVSKDFTQEKDCTSYCAGGCRACSPGAVLGQVEHAIRALLPAAVAEPAAKTVQLCEAGRPEINGECDCAPPDSLEDEPVRDIVDIVEQTNVGPHVPVYHGDAAKVGVSNRWSWSCRCGSGSQRADMTMAGAIQSFARHVAEPAAKCANPECIKGQVPSNQGGWMSPVPCPSCGGAR